MKRSVITQNLYSLFGTVIDCHFAVIAGNGYKGLVRKYNRIGVGLHAPKKDF